MGIAVGQSALDLSFLKSNGTWIPLRELQGKPVLLIFLRHLA
jgi:peroxiredoxin